MSRKFACMTAIMLSRTSRHSGSASRNGPFHGRDPRPDCARPASSDAKSLKTTIRLVVPGDDGAICVRGQECVMSVRDARSRTRRVLPAARRSPAGSASRARANGEYDARARAASAEARPRSGVSARSVTPCARGPARAACTSSKPMPARSATSSRRSPGHVPPAGYRHADLGRLERPAPFAQERAESAKASIVGHAPRVRSSDRPGSPRRAHSRPEPTCASYHRQSYVCSNGSAAARVASPTLRTVPCSS